MNQTNVEKAAAIAQKYNQTHLLKALAGLGGMAAEKLSDQILAIDFEKMKMLFQLSQAPTSLIHEKSKIEPFHAISSHSMDQSVKSALTEKGLEMLKSNRVAVLTMAGGQGTRLGFKGPKGSFVLPLPIEKSLFQIQGESLLSYNVPWYIMTSEENDIETREYFESHAYFGYRRSLVTFFKQGELPILDVDGKVVMKDSSNIYFAPDGNGGVFRSLEKSGVLKQMKSIGIEWIFLCNIDNLLIRIADPLFIGFTLKSKATVSNKSVLKRSPQENTGVFAFRDGKVSIIEYTELPEELRYRRNPSGELAFADVNIVNHLMKIDFIEEVAQKNLPFHTAFKATPYMLADGATASAERPNSYKFESFLFDSFALTDKVAVLRVDRDDEFAPVKNKTGDDSPDTAVGLYEEAMKRKL